MAAFSLEPAVGGLCGAPLGPISLELAQPLGQRVRKELPHPFADRAAAHVGTRSRQSPAINRSSTSTCARFSNQTAMIARMVWRTMAGTRAGSVGEPPLAYPARYSIRTEPAPQSANGQT